MSVDETNQKQTDSLSALRQSIQARKQVYKDELELPFVENKPKIQEVPKITIESDSDFQLERYEQLKARVDVLYNNYMVILLQLQENIGTKLYQDEYIEILKDLAKTFDSFIFEGIKPRFK